MQVKIAFLFKENRWFLMLFFLLCNTEWIVVKSETDRTEIYVFIREILD